VCLFVCVCVRTSVCLCVLSMCVNPLSQIRPTQGWTLRWPSSHQAFAFPRCFQSAWTAPMSTAVGGAPRHSVRFVRRSDLGVCCYIHTHAHTSAHTHGHVIHISIHIHIRVARLIPVRLRAHTPVHTPINVHLPISM